jgi:hypothetical protein
MMNQIAKIMAKIRPLKIQIISQYSQKPNRYHFTQAAKKKTEAERKKGLPSSKQPTKKNVLPQAALNKSCVDFPNFQSTRPLSIRIE